MSEFLLKNKFIIFLCSIIVILSISLFATSFGMEEYKKTDFSLGIVNTDYLNMRTGAGINFDSTKVLRRNEYVRIFGQIDDWYIVQTDDNRIGTVNVNYITPNVDSKPAVNNVETIENDENVNLTSNELDLLNLINEERQKNNLSNLEIDDTLQNVARLKAEDLVKNNYFSHISPTYGTPFEMLKFNNISYKTASENIAGNSDITLAFKSWMDSESHRNNILSNNFNYTGIGVVDSIAYGKIIVEFFIGK